MIERLIKCPPAYRVRFDNVLFPRKNSHNIRAFHALMHSAQCSVYTTRTCKQHKRNSKRNCSGYFLLLPLFSSIDFANIWQLNCKQITKVSSIKCWMWPESVGRPLSHLIERNLSYAARVHRNRDMQRGRREREMPETIKFDTSSFVVGSKVGCAVCWLQGNKSIRNICCCIALHC